MKGDYNTDSQNHASILSTSITKIYRVNRREFI